MQKDYYKRYGTSMRGMMTEHGMNPDEYLAYVHHIDHSPLEPNPALGAAIEKLPGRKLILTNGTRAHADAVMRRLDIHMHFDDVFGINEAEPRAEAAAADLRQIPRKRTASIPQRAAMFEDLARNLAVPHALGMTTVLVVPAKTREVFREAGRWKAATPTMSITSPTISPAFWKHPAAVTPHRAALDIPRGCTSPDKPGPLSGDFPHVRPRQDHRRRLRGAQRRDAGHQGRGARRGRGGARPARPRRGARRREAGERRVAGQPVAQEGGAALVPPQRHGRRSPAGPAAPTWWDKVPSKFDGWGENRFRAAGFRAVPGCDRAPLGLHRARTSC